MSFPLYSTSSGNTPENLGVIIYAGMTVIQIQPGLFINYTAANALIYVGSYVGIALNTCTPGNSLSAQLDGLVPQDLFTCGPGSESTVVVTGTGGVARGTAGLVLGECDPAGVICVRPTRISSQVGIIHDQASFGQPTVGQSPVLDSTGKWTFAQAGSTNFAYGYGAAGAVVFDGVTAVLGFTLVGSTYTATQHDKQFTTAVVNPGVTVISGNFGHRFSVSLTMNGLWKAPQGASTGTYVGGGVGGAGGTSGNPGSQGLNPVDGTGAQALAPAGHEGGTGGTGNSAANAGGTCQAPLDTPGDSAGPAAVETGYVFSGSSTSAYIPQGGGSGGGGGGGGSATAGGAGGNGGGQIRIWAKTLLGNGTFSASGGQGIAAPAGSGGGGGGGAGGMIVISTANASAWTGTLSATGGTGGAAGGAGGVAGANGGDGLAIIYTN